MKIFDAAVSAEWAIEESALQKVLEIAARENAVTPEALEAYRAKTLEKADRAKVRDGVAILDVAGPLFKGANLMTEMSGATSYQLLRRDLQTALDDGNVKSILLNIDSPGGEARGVGELATAIFEARGKKPIVAYASDLAASAAYWIASAADRIMIGKGAALGSIGVRAAYQDASAAQAARGVKTIEFVSSQSPYKATDLNSKDGRARVQSRVDALASVFIEAVAMHRGVSVARVQDGFGRGDVLIGQAAIDAGMADGLGTFESVLAGLVREADPFAAGGFFPARSTLQQEQESAMPNDIEAAANAESENVSAGAATTENEAGASAPEAAAGAEPEQASEPSEVERAVAAERARYAEIKALTLPGYEKAADEAIKTGSSAHEFAAFIVAQEKTKREARAADVVADTEANAKVKPNTGAGTGPSSDVEALVKSVMSSRAAALGQ